MKSERPFYLLRLEWYFLGERLNRTQSCSKALTMCLSRLGGAGTIPGSWKDASWASRHGRDPPALGEGRAHASVWWNYGFQTWTPPYPGSIRPLFAWDVRQLVHHELDQHSDHPNG